MTRRKATSEPRSPAALHDIPRCIIPHLDPDPYINTWHEEGASIRQALGRLAIAHSTFTQPALAALWRSLSDDEVLKQLLCVVGIARKVPQQNGSGGALVELCGALQTDGSGWKRFQVYASLVQKIIVHPYRVSNAWNSPPTFLHDTFWCQIVSVLGDLPILPRLSAMHFVITDSRHSIDMGALRLLNPCTQELTIEFNWAPSEHETRLEAAFASCLSSTRNLKRLSLQLACSIVDFEAFPQSHPHLRHLRVDAPATTPHLTSIASLPELECLSIYLSELVNPPLNFKVLCNLSITSSGLDNATILHTAMNAPRLRKLSIASSHMTSLDLRTKISQCLHLLIVRFPSLISFHWKCSQIEGVRYCYLRPRNPGATLAELIEPLLSLRTLRDLSLEFRGPIVPYSPSDFYRMAEARPDLETFALALKDADEGDSEALRLQYADYDSLASFARHCARLYSLCIPRVRIDTVAYIPSLSSDESSPTPASHQLRHLIVNHGVLCPDAPGRGYEAESQRNRAFVEMMKPLFPFAAVYVPGITVVPPPTVVIS